MKNFAKLFETEKYGQLLVTLEDDLPDDDGNECPGLKMQFDPCIRGVKVSAATILLLPGEAGDEAAEKAFENMDEKGAVGWRDALEGELAPMREFQNGETE